MLTHPQPTGINIPSLQTPPTTNLNSPTPPETPQTSDPVIENEEISVAKGKIWPKILIGTVLLLTVGGGVIWWLASQNKIDLPIKNIPGISNNKSTTNDGNNVNNVPSKDAEFASYLRTSLTKIESNYPRASEPMVTPTTTLPVPNLQPKPIETKSKVVKIITKPKEGAEIEINGKKTNILVGEKIGNTGFSLVKTAKDRIVVKGKDGKEKAIAVGQDF
jgi:hypothetical protein